VLGVTLPALVGISFAFVAVSTSMTTLLQTTPTLGFAAGFWASTHHLRRLQHSERLPTGSSHIQSRGCSPQSASGRCWSERPR